MSEASQGSPAPQQQQRGPKAKTDDDLRLVSTAAFAALSVVLVGLVLMGLMAFVGVELDAPTLALALTCAVMIWSLRGMWNIVVALTRPQAATLVVEAEAGADHSTLAELREEKRRVLRAIKELEFDHDMGKLSDEDFEEISARYKLRAIEVMRRLDQDKEIHPLLVAHLQAIESWGGLLDEDGDEGEELEPSTDEAPEDASSDEVVVHVGGPQ